MKAALMERRLKRKSRKANRLCLFAPYRGLVFSYFDRLHKRVQHLSNATATSRTA